jgi:exodeoxyribonuclease VII large subunit
MKILNARWGGVEVQHIDVQVQGEVAPGQITAAIEQFNAQAEPPEVIVVTRGGGSAEDLAAFSTEQVTRAVAGSRVPTLVAIGHEIDLSLAELAADRRASTPSNAAEFLVPDRDHVAAGLKASALQLQHLGKQRIKSARDDLQAVSIELTRLMEYVFEQTQQQLSSSRQLLTALSPEAILKRGYAIVRQGGASLRSVKQLKDGIVDIQLADGTFKATTQKKGSA